MHLHRLSINHRSIELSNSFSNIISGIHVNKAIVPNNITFHNSAKLGKKFSDFWSLSIVSQVANKNFDCGSMGTFLTCSGLYFDSIVINYEAI